MANLPAGRQEILYLDPTFTPDPFRPGSAYFAYKTQRGFYLSIKPPLTFRLPWQPFCAKLQLLWPFFPGSPCGLPFLNLNQSQSAVASFSFLIRCLVHWPPALLSSVELQTVARNHSLIPLPAPGFDFLVLRLLSLILLTPKNCPG